MCYAKHKSTPLSGAHLACAELTNSEPRKAGSANKIHKQQHFYKWTFCAIPLCQRSNPGPFSLWTTHIVSFNEPLSDCLLKFKVQHSTWWPHSALHLSAPNVLGFLNSNVNDMETQIWDWCPSVKQSIKKHPAPKHPDLVLSRVKNGAAITNSTFTTLGPARDEEWKWHHYVNMVAMTWQLHEKK